MRTPTIHLNGSDPDTLLAAHAGALSALRAAVRKMEDAAPNARDFYVQGDAAYAEASKEHNARVADVRRVIGAFEALYESILDQRDERDAARALHTK